MCWILSCRKRGPEAFLKQFSGFRQADEYSGYDQPDSGASSGRPSVLSLTVIGGSSPSAPKQDSKLETAFAAFQPGLTPPEEIEQGVVATPSLHCDSQMQRLVHSMW